MTLPIRLRLYVTDNTVPSVRATRNLDALRATMPEGDSEAEIIDVRRHPELAEQDRIIATPTLVLMGPEPRRKVIGDIGDIEAVALMLGLPAINGAAKAPGGLL